MLPATSLAVSAENAPTGIYSVEKEIYYSKTEFKAMSSAQKKKIFKEKWFISTGGQVFPISAMLLPSTLLISTAEKQVDFERKNNVDLNEIASGGFEVTTIE
ncbi:hypothetical protein HMPREF9372_1231 [Sporosarcina newyorkensis 2681]|uniref:Uncharacterized protein n=2 Tax=Caryophanaceae TaxID=186818 RepID=F9DR01_9BACL|nr:hypothetical protein HMPREF9372_1231 [Sporosarcina newyorkensis 2681]